MSIKEETENKLFDKFTKYLFKLRTIDLFGIAHMFNVPITVPEKEEMRDGAEVVADILTAFSKLSNTKKKEILKLCEAAYKNSR